MSAIWLDSRTAAALLGVDRSYFLREAKKGKYGRTRLGTVDPAQPPVLLVSSRAIELVACRVFTDAHIIAAGRGDEAFSGPHERPEFGGQPLDFVPSPEMVAADVAVTRHDNDRDLVPLPEDDEL